MLALRGQQSGAPLESTQSELKALQKAQSQKNSSEGGKASVSLPQLQIVTPGATPLEMPNPQKMEKELAKKKEAQKNWLVDGVQQLEKKQQAKAERGDAISAQGTLNPEQATQAPDKTPGSLLEVYTEQQNEAEKKESAKPAAKTAPLADPLAPFLREWMGNSPVRGEFFDKVALKPETGASPVVANGGSPVSGNSSAMNGGPEFSGRGAAEIPSAKNPYLAGIESPTVHEPSRPAPVPAGLNFNEALSGSFVPSAATNSVPPLPENRVNFGDKKPLIPDRADDKKYFPQLKKF
ncbi:hypothetical protein [Oleiharenicola lentus]|uniref:hypothetical protein n=1 Tax=Oleiharenicola lentus TaxID=2508720 RepID=UPI003F66F146